jgi:ADP-heptose:LPS heptosyltransferase
MAALENPVVIHVHSNGLSSKNWPLEKWQELLDTLPGYTFVQLGVADDPKMEGAVDCRGKASLRETFALIKHASGFIGVDSSLAHVTNAFGVPGVVLFGPSSPENWGHANNINVYKKLICSPCIPLLQHCPYQKECIKTIAVDEVRAAVLQHIVARNNTKKPLYA